LLVYGDEIGMGENLRLEGRNSVRTPMQWNSQENGGFSAARPGRLLRKPITTGPFSIKKVNVERQQKDDFSLLNWMQRLIFIRKSCSEIGWGQPKAITSDQAHVLAHSYEWKDNVIVFTHNFKEQPTTFSIKSKEFHPRQFVDIFSDTDYEPTQEHTTQLFLKGYGYRWFRVNLLKTKQ